MEGISDGFSETVVSNALLQGRPEMMVSCGLLCLGLSCFHSLAVRPVGDHGRKQLLVVCPVHGLFPVDHFCRFPWVSLLGGHPAPLAFMCLHR